MRTQKLGVHEIQLDYSFLKLHEETAATVLLGIHVQSGYGLALVVRSKGTSEMRAPRAVRRWLEEVGIRGKIRLRTDGEYAIRLLAEVVAKERGEE